MLPWIAVGAILFVNVISWLRPPTSVSSFANGIFALLFVALGSLIESRQRGNRIGRLLMIFSGTLAIEAMIRPTIQAVESAPSAISPQLLVALMLDNITWILVILTLISILYIFPTGGLLSRRWLWAPWLAVVAVTTIISSTVLGAEIGPVNESWSAPNPAGIIGAPLSDGLRALGLLCLPILAVGGLVAFTLRYRRSTYVGRTQIKFVLAPIALWVVSFLGLIVFDEWSWDTPVAEILMVIAIIAMPISITIAILRYNLFDIDVVISRSLTYGLLAVFIGGVYVAIVVGIGEVFSDGEGASVGLSIVATAVVAFAFQPVRRRVEHWANRLVYGERATPYEVLARFSQRAAEMSDEDLLARIPRLIVDGTRASGAALWVKSGASFDTAASWPESDVTRTIDATHTFDDPDADYSLPVIHDGELLGGISLVNERGETITPAEEELLANLADGMGLALRNTQLTVELRRQVKDLKRSRDRVVSAADEARRSLEHDLDSGPQQQLVAVKVKLGPTRMLAERAGADKTAKVLADIEEQAGDAISAIREFAAGIYPPLLGAEGLAVALAQQTQKAALPVTLNAESIGRYPRDVEAAVYFTVLEALQNTAKYADASSAEVRLTEDNGDLRFEISDNGLGFDTSQTSKGAGLNGITDRMDTVGGTWQIQSTPETGTVITGAMPVRERTLVGSL